MNQYAIFGITLLAFCSLYILGYWHFLYTSEHVVDYHVFKGNNISTYQWRGTTGHSDRWYYGVYSIAYAPFIDQHGAVEHEVDIIASKSVMDIRDEVADRYDLDEHFAVYNPGQGNVVVWEGDVQKHEYYVTRYPIDAYYRDGKDWKWK